jgi:hypothetical protein
MKKQYTGKDKGKATARSFKDFLTYSNVGVCKNCNVCKFLNKDNLCKECNKEKDEI